MDYHTVSGVKAEMVWRSVGCGTGGVGRYRPWGGEDAALMKGPMSRKVLCHGSTINITGGASVEVGGESLGACQVDEVRAYLSLRQLETMRETAV